MADDINACEIVLELCFEVAKEASRGRLKPVYSIGLVRRNVREICLCNRGWGSKGLGLGNAKD